MRETTNLSIGQVVISKSGRDKGRKFVIIEIIDHEYVYIVDGDLRKINNPKKKKVMHLQHTKIILEDIAVIVNKNEHLSDDSIRSTLDILYKKL